MVRAFDLGPRMHDSFTQLYFFGIDATPDCELSDCHYPDWAGVNFLASGDPHSGALWGEPLQRMSPCLAYGPTRRSLSVQLRNSRSWSIGIKPLGWARYAIGPASAVANSLLNGADHPAFARLAPMQAVVERDPDDPDGTARQIIGFLNDLPPACTPHEEQVDALHRALCDPTIGDVDALVKKVGFSRRTIERLSSRYFGFAPKLLLRRQRFLRSLGKFLQSSQNTWSASLDGHYVDQAHFVRDFRAFMGMTPTEYAQMPRILPKRIATLRLQDQGVDPR